jgi:hypothetical protein
MKSQYDPPLELRRSSRIRKGRKVLTYERPGVPKIQRYPSIFNIEYRQASDLDEFDTLSDAHEVGGNDKRTHNCNSPVSWKVAPPGTPGSRAARLRSPTNNVNKHNASHISRAHIHT